MLQITSSSFIRIVPRMHRSVSDQIVDMKTTLTLKSRESLSYHSNQHKHTKGIKSFVHSFDPPIHPLHTLIHPLIHSFKHLNSDKLLGESIDIRKLKTSTFIASMLEARSKKTCIITGAGSSCQQLSSKSIDAIPTKVSLSFSLVLSFRVQKNVALPVGIH